MALPMQELKILIAISNPELQEMVSNILQRHELRIVSSVDRAVDALCPDLDLILCGLHFDRGRMYEFLKHAKASPVVKAVPFLCVQLSSGILPYGAFRSMESAFHVLGGDKLLQVDKWRIELGDEAAFAKLVDVVESMTIGQMLTTREAA